MSGLDDGEMKSVVEDNIRALSQAILAQARDESEKVLSDSREKAEAIRKHAEEQAAAVRSEIITRATEDAERIRSQMIATTQLKARTLQLERREKLLDQVFTTVQGQLATVQQWTDYGEITQTLLREALEKIGAPEVIVHADEHTREVLSKHILDALSKEMNVKINLGSLLEKRTGVVVETPDQHLRFDNTLETRLDRMQSSLRSPVYHLLMGEAL